MACPGSMNNLNYCSESSPFRVWMTRFVRRHFHGWRAGGKEQAASRYTLDGWRTSNLPSPQAGKGKGRSGSESSKFSEISEFSEAARRRSRVRGDVN